MEEKDGAVDEQRLPPEAYDECVRENIGRESGQTNEQDNQNRTITGKRVTMQVPHWCHLN